MGPGLTASVRSTSMVVSRGQALRPKFSTRCYKCLQLSISDPFLPFWAPDWLCHVLIHSWSPIFANEAMTHFPNSILYSYSTSKEQRHNHLWAPSSEGFLLPHLKPHNYSVNKISFKTAAAFANWGQKAPASPREGGLMPQPTAFLCPAPCPKANTCPPKQSLASQGAPMRLKK